MVRVKKSHRCCRCMPFLIITLVASFVMTTLIPVSKICGLKTSSHFEVNLNYAFLCDYICPLDLKMLFCHPHSRVAQALITTTKAGEFLDDCSFSAKTASFCYMKVFI